MAQLTLAGLEVLATVFEITPAGNLTTLHNFCSKTNCTDGADPIAGLIQATDGNFYGTTQGGGAPGWGTVFKIAPTGALTTLHAFTLNDGGQPYGGLLQPQTETSTEPRKTVAAGMTARCSPSRLVRSDPIGAYRLRTGKTAMHTVGRGALSRALSCAVTSLINIQNRGAQAINVRRYDQSKSSACLVFDLDFRLHPGTRSLVFPASTYRSL